MRNFIRSTNDNNQSIEQHRPESLNVEALRFYTFRAKVLTVILILVNLLVFSCIIKLQRIHYPFLNVLSQIACPKTGCSKYTLTFHYFELVDITVYTNKYSLGKFISRI